MPKVGLTLGAAWELLHSNAADFKLMARSSFVGGNTGQHYGHGGHGGHGGYGDYNYHQGGYHDGYQASHPGHHQQSHHGHHQHGGNSGHHGYDAHDRGYQNYDLGYENYQVDQGYDQSNGPEPGDAKPIPDGEPMSIASEGDGSDEVLPAVEDPDSTATLEAGEGLPPPELEEAPEGDEALEVGQMDDIPAPSDTGEPLEEGGGEGPPLMLVNSEGQNLLAKEKTRQLINKVKILSKTLQAKLPTYDEGSDLPEMEDEMREICRAREVEINKIDQARTAAEIARLESEEEPGQGDEAAIQEEAKKIREEWPGDEFDEHYGYGPPQGEPGYGAYGGEYGYEGGHGGYGSHGGYEDYGGHAAHAGAPYKHGAAAMPPVAHAACPLVAVGFPLVTGKCSERLALRARHVQRQAEFLCEVC